MAIERLGIKTVPLTRAIAKSHAELDRLPCDRVLSEEHMLDLHAKLADGLFHDPDWAVVMYKDEVYSVDGKHSANMLNRCGGEFPAGLKVTIREFATDSPEDNADLFMQFDNRKWARTSGQIIKAHASAHDALSGIAPAWINKTLAGIVTFSNDGKSKIVGDEERARLIHNNIKFITWAHPFVKSREHGKPGVVAAMYATWHKDAAAATEFWTLVKDESHPKTNNPTRVLAKFLSDNRMKIGATLPSAKWNSRTFLVKCIHGWNAWRSGTTTMLNYYDSADVPRVL